MTDRDKLREELKTVTKQRTLHHSKADKGYEMKRSLIKEANKSWEGKERLQNAEPNSIEATNTISVDFQQNLPLPVLTHGDVFYARQLWVYNFGVHDTVNQQGTMHVWSEATAKRGSSEVASCLENYFQKHGYGAKHLNLISDGCGGQNKNKTMMHYCMSKTDSLNQFSSIDHYILVRGHTYLPNDEDFSVIERRKKVKTHLFTVDHWVDTIKESKVTPPVFEVVKMEQHEFLDYKKGGNRVKPKLVDRTGQKSTYKRCPLVLIWRE